MEGSTIEVVSCSVKFWCSPAAEMSREASTREGVACPGMLLQSIKLHVSRRVGSSGFPFTNRNK